MALRSEKGGEKKGKKGIRKFRSPQSEVNIEQERKKGEERSLSSLHVSSDWREKGSFQHFSEYQGGEKAQRRNKRWEREKATLELTFMSQKQKKEKEPLEVSSLNPSIQRQR